MPIPITNIISPSNINNIRTANGIPMYKPILELSSPVTEKYKNNTLFILIKNSVLNLSFCRL